MAALVKEYDIARLVDAKDLVSLERLRSLFPTFSGTEFYVIPVERSMDFSTEEVTLHNSAWLSLHSDRDEW
jgi:hypothetical protein